MTDEEWTSISHAFSSPRRLRTRATGTLFWVKASNSEFTITPGSGRDRVVPRAEFAACWPFITDDQPRSNWRHLTNNASYLEAVFDAVEGASERERPTPAEPSARDAAPLVDSRQLRIGILEEQVHDLQRQLGDVDSLREDIPRLRSKVRALESTSEGKEREIERLRTELARLRLAEPPSQDVGLLTGRLSAAERARDDLQSLHRQAQEDLGQMVEARKLQADELATAKATEERLRGETERLKREFAAKPMPLALGISLGDLKYDLAASIDPSLKEDIRAGAARVFADPDASIAATRRALETTCRLLLTQSYGAPDDAVPMRYILDTLRNDPVMPDSDWHLAKNVWSRASAFVHEGGATPLHALWAWLSVVQLAQLTTGQFPRALRKAVSGPPAPGGPRGL